jgi:hypothetical protein
MGLQRSPRIGQAPVMDISGGRHERHSAASRELH